MSSAREPGDLAQASSVVVTDGQTREGKPQSVVGTRQKSDEAVVPRKPTKTRVTPVEPVEGRAEAEGKSTARNASPAQDGKDALTYLQWIGKRAKEKPEEQFTNLLSHVKVPLLKEAFYRLRKDAAPGIDGVTWAEYADGLDDRLLDLQDRIHRGSYHPQPVRRVYIPKGDGRTRPLGVPSLEDKIVQQAARMVLEPIYEAMFVGFSYGFRPGRSQHDALDALAEAIARKVSWVLDADIRSFFDTIDHGWMQKLLEHRIGDSRMVRLVMKWVRAGVMEEGELRDVEEGTPQGGIISPLLANIYLHYALDLWACQWRKRHARGEVYIVRYADDVVMGFQLEQDAQAMRTAVGERLTQFGLELHLDKTRVLRFGRYAREQSERHGEGRPATFDFLGFTHIADVNRRGGFVLRRRTSRKKRRAKLAQLKEECRRRRHHDVADQHRWLSSVLRGHCQYYAVPTNFRALSSFRWELSWTWHRSLQRRSQCGNWTLERWRRFVARYPLPLPRIVHPWPTERFACR
jgi:group II intron reverse transcriptase/maturase